MSFPSIIKKIRTHPRWGPLYNRARSLFPRYRFLIFRMDITNRCNLRCTMCNRRLAEIRNQVQKPYDLPPDKFRRVAREVFPLARELYLNLGAEPMMSRHFLTILDITSRYRVPCVAFFTNATLMNEERARAIVTRGVSRILVSMEGATAKTYESIRVGAKFDTVLKNIRRLKEIKHELGSPTPQVEFTTVLMRSNIEEFADFVDLAHGLEAKVIHYGHQLVYKGLRDESLSRDKELSDRCVREAWRRAAAHGMEIKGPPLFESCAGKTPPAAPAPPERQLPLCGFPWNQAVMELDGKILPCCTWYNEEPMGNIFEETFDRIWFGERYETLRRQLSTGEDLCGMCRRCPSVVSGRVDEDSFPVIEP